MKHFIKNLFIQYAVTYLAMSIIYFSFISYSYNAWYRWDFDYISELEATAFMLLFFSFAIFVVNDVIFRAIWDIKVSNIELYFLVSIFTVIFIKSDFSFMSPILHISSNFLLSPIIFWLYLLYRKHFKKS